MDDTQLSVVQVLARIEAAVRNDENDAQMYAEYLEVLLDNLLGQDAFGTEGQCDPRGDRRNGDWSMWDVEP